MPVHWSSSSGPTSIVSLGFDRELSKPALAALSSAYAIAASELDVFRATKQAEIVIPAKAGIQGGHDARRRQGFRKAEPGYDKLGIFGDSRHYGLVCVEVQAMRALGP
jgi:hypothetical protein